MKGRPLMLAKPMLVSPSKKQQGAVAVFMILALPFLIGTMGYALDVGKWFVVKSELQNAADACALAAAYELDGQAGAQARATAAGLNLAQANKVLLQENLVTAGNTTVSFFSNANGDFVRCNITQPNINNTFLNVLGIGDKTIASAATATNRPGQSTCAIPISICQSAIAGKPKGTWLKGILTPGSSSGGQFNWTDLNVGGGAKTLSELIKTDNACFANPPLDTPIGVSGFKASVRDEYNSRFGVYANSVKGNPTPAPDISGKGYFTSNWTINTDAYADYQSKPYTPYTNLNGIEFAGKPDIYTSAQLQANGKHRRVAPAPIVDCNDGQKLKGYACMFLLHPVATKGSASDMYLEYLGNAETDVTPCTQSGLAGDGSINGPRVSTLVQ